jgi:outer membrane protein assembly factor BamB
MNLAKRFMTAAALGMLLANPHYQAQAGGHWPQWRGVLRDGVATDTGLLKSWPAEGPPLAWKTVGLGGGFSGVAIVDGRIFTAGDATDASYVFALEEAGGKPVWRAMLGKTGGGSGYPGPRCTPTVANGLVYALGQFGDLVCVEATAGKEQWRTRLEQDLGGKMMSVWGYSESPLVDGDFVICTPGGPGGTLAALNKNTGALAWRSKDLTEAAAYASAIAIDLGGVRQYAQVTGESVVGVAATNGALLWRAPRKGAIAVVPTPIFHEDCIFVSSADGAGCNLINVAATNGAFSATQVYANKVMANHHGGVILLGDYLYGYSEGKGWVCQEFKTGKLVWNEKGKLGKGSIAYADGCLYLRLEKDQGTVALIEASPKGYHEISRFDPPERSDKNSWPPAVIADGKLYLRDQDALLVYDLKAK